MALTAQKLGVRLVRHMEFRGTGYFAGLAPDVSDPDSPDGRFRKLNVPARGRISVFERGSMRVVAETRSAADGTWSVRHLDRARTYVIIGSDDSGVQNAAIQDWVRPAPME